MHSPTLTDLPPPPPGKSGWPWTEESPPQPATLPDGRPWPRISIVTPSFNQGQFIEATIRSVLLQGYPDLEVIVIDGGSTDQTVDVIRNYAPWLTHWVSEPDRGQSHAINKGLERCTGQIFNWINSDDHLAKGALAEVGRLWTETTPHIVAGRCRAVDLASGLVTSDWPPSPPRNLSHFLRTDGPFIPQPSAFLDLQLLRRIAGLREDLHYVLDWDLYFRIASTLRNDMRIATTNRLLSYSGLHPAAKTVSLPAKFRLELRQVINGYLPGLSPADQRAAHTYLRDLDLAIRVLQAVSVQAGQFRRLLRIVIARPDALFSRYYLGSLRRANLPYAEWQSVSSLKWPLNRRNTDTASVNESND